VIGSIGDLCKDYAAFSGVQESEALKVLTTPGPRRTREEQETVNAWHKDARRRGELQ
jgi:hypothetical protein